LPADYPIRYSDSTAASEIALTMTDATGAATILDTKGLLCPLPVLKARRVLKTLAPGAVLEVLATDPGAVKDFEHFCQTTGCELLETSETDGVLRFRLKKPG
jgi:tRNA 2-thiouridine synthesizing protein A